MSEKQCNLIGGGMKEVIDLIYPVGQTIIRDHNPQNDYPWQTWVADAADRVIVGEGTAHKAGDTGGSESVTLSDNNMSRATIVDKFSDAGGWGAAFITVPQGEYRMGLHENPVTPISIMQPYIVKRYWTRTA